MMKKIIMLTMITCLFSSCVVVKEYEKVNINDPDMALADKKCDRNVTTAHSYREAAVGANGGKTGGGCGCN
jgi:PBP1b-binding outer membrane lipoprotein LpoB